MPVLAAGTRQLASVSYLDGGGERGAVKGLYLPVITAANEAAQSTAWGVLLGAMDDIVLGARIRDAYVDQTTYPVLRPTNGAAREIALKLIARDATTGQTWDIIIPTLNQALIEYDPNYGAKDVVDITTTEVAALIDALEAMPLKNPYNYANNGTIVGAAVVRGLK